MATHLTFFFVVTSHSEGSPFIAETILRDGVPPHIGQSPDSCPDAGARDGTTMTERTPTIRRSAWIFALILTAVFFVDSFDSSQRRYNVGIGGVKHNTSVTLLVTSNDKRH